MIICKWFIFKIEYEKHKIDSKTKMKAMNSVYVILLIVFASTCNVKTCFAAYSKNNQAPGSSWKVTIINYQKDATLTVHCKSKDNDLGKCFDS